MAIRFRKSIKIAPGVRVNLGKKGASVSVGARGASVNIGKRGTHIHGIAFRLVGVVFATLPISNTVFISGYSQRLDSSTGKINDDYLFSFKVDRNSFKNIDFESLENVDPVVAMETFENRRKMTATGIFKPIEPFQPAV